MDTHLHTAINASSSASNLNGIKEINNNNQVENGMNTTTAMNVERDLLVDPSAILFTSNLTSASISSALPASSLSSIDPFSHPLLLNQIRPVELERATAKERNLLSIPSSSSVISSPFPTTIIPNGPNTSSNISSVAFVPETITSSPRNNLKRNASEEILNIRPHPPHPHPASSTLTSTSSTFSTVNGQVQSQANVAGMEVDINSVDWGNNNDLSGLLEAAAAASNSVASTSFLEGDEDAEGEDEEEEEEEEFKPKANVKAKGKGKAKAKAKSKSNRPSTVTTPKRPFTSSASFSNTSRTNSNSQDQQPTLVRTSQISPNDIHNSTPVEFRVLFHTSTASSTISVNTNPIISSTSTSTSVPATSTSTLTAPATTSSLPQAAGTSIEATVVDEEQNDLNRMALNWSNEEWSSRRRLVQIYRVQDQNIVTMRFRPISQLAYDTLLQNGADQEELVVVSCIYRDEWNECFVTSVDAIWLLERLILGTEYRDTTSGGTPKIGKGKSKVVSAGAKIIGGGGGEKTFSVEEKNRIRRNLEGFKPFTVSKTKSTNSSSVPTNSTITAPLLNPTTTSTSNAGSTVAIPTTDKEMENFFRLIMSYKEPRPRKIEKDLKVFPWKVLSDCLEKILNKFSAITPTSSSNPNTGISSITTSAAVSAVNPTSSPNPALFESSPQISSLQLMNQNAPPFFESQSLHQVSQQSALSSLHTLPLSQQLVPHSPILQQPILKVPTPLISTEVAAAMKIEVESEKETQPTKSLEDLFEESSTNWDLSSLPLPLRSNREVEE